MEEDGKISGEKTQSLNSNLQVKEDQQVKMNSSIIKENINLERMDK